MQSLNVSALKSEMSTPEQYLSYKLYFFIHFYLLDSRFKQMIQLYQAFLHCVLVVAQWYSAHLVFKWFWAQILPSFFSFLHRQSFLSQIPQGGANLGTHEVKALKIVYKGVLPGVKQAH